MLADTIIIVAVALIAGYAGAQWQKRRQGWVTKREATELRRDLDEMKAVFNEHWDVHKALKFQVETLGQNMALIADTVGIEQSRPIH